MDEKKIKDLLITFFSHYPFEVTPAHISYLAQYLVLNLEEQNGEEET